MFLSWGEQGITGLLNWENQVLQASLVGKILGMITLCSDDVEGDKTEESGMSMIKEHIFLLKFCDWIDYYKDQS